MHVTFPTTINKKKGVRRKREKERERMGEDGRGVEGETKREERARMEMEN